MDESVKKKTITEDVVRYVAQLSRLRLDEKDVHKFQEQLARILDYIAQLNEVNTENIPPTSHVLSSMKNVFREDEVKKSIPVEEALQNAPSKEKDFFKVPKIIKDV